MAPDLPIVATITDYAGPNVVSAMLPYQDVVLPLWPYRDFTLPGQPGGYIPRDTFYSTILPAMKAWRDQTGGILASYHITEGRAGPTTSIPLSVGFGNRVYPIAAFGDGLYGGSHWAYNVWYGSSWDGADADNIAANVPDWLFVYDGLEDHPLNHAHNVEGELLVPSIRWQALREGMQDAELLLFLQGNKGSYSSAMQTEIDDLISEAAVIAAEFAANNYSKADDSVYISDYSDRIRNAYFDAIVDTDGDGLPDWWETQYYGGPTAANTNDICANGVNIVLDAYIAGFNPTNALAGFSITGFDADAGLGHYALQWNEAAGRVYTVHWTSNLLDGFTTFLTNNYSGGTFTDTVHGADSEGFYRMEVEIAP